MFNSLYNLYRKSNSNRTPLEDFNTECFAGVLRMSPDILKSLIKFLKLPEGKYNVSTQAHYSLVDTSNCIIDMVLESESSVCFIENKVNSEEGWQQLPRYIQVLDRYYNNTELEKKKSTYLRYCTKNVDIKTIEEHQFRQFRWFQIGKLLADNHKSDALGINYLNFLQQHDMAIDPSISTDTVVTLKNFWKTFHTMIYHVESSTKNFKNTFPRISMEKRSNSIWHKELREKGRLSNSINNPLKDKSGVSEILYSIEFHDVQLQSQIWISKNHTQYTAVKKLAEELKHFEFIESNEYGLGLRNRKPLYSFIDSPNSDEEIKQWFKESFDKIRAFIDSTPELNWDGGVSKP